MINARRLPWLFGLLIQPVTMYALLGARTVETRQEQLPPPTQPPIHWPARAPVRFTCQQHFGQWDGLPIAYLRLLAGKLDLQIRHDVADDWLVATQTAYSFEANFRWQPEARLTLAVFPRHGSFLSSLEDAAWSRYRSSYPHQGDSASVRQLDDDSNVNADMLRLLDQRIRVWGIEQTSINNDRTPQGLIQIFVEFPEVILVLGLDGPTPAVLDATKAFERFALSLQRLSPDEGDAQ